MAHLTPKSLDFALSPLGSLAALPCDELDPPMQKNSGLNRAQAAGHADRARRKKLWRCPFCGGSHG